MEYLVALLLLVVLGVDGLSGVIGRRLRRGSRPARLEDPFGAHKDSSSP